MATITCSLKPDGLRFETQIRDYTLQITSPPSVGGENVGPTPPELMVAALGSCVGVYALLFCHKHSISTEGLTVSTDWEKAEHPARIGRMTVSIDLPAGIPTEQHEAFMKTVEACLVHNTFHHTPEITIALTEPAAANGCCCCGK
jgi:putative redox protein